MRCSLLFAALGLLVVFGGSGCATNTVKKSIPGTSGQIETVLATKVREGPNSRSDVLSIIPSGKVLQYISRDGDYWKVKWPGGVGWINEVTLFVPQSIIAMADADSRREELAKREQRLSDKRQRLSDLGGTFTEEIARRIIKRRIWIGMTSSMARESRGRPKDINRTVTAGTISEQWVYPGGVYLYFENDVLTAWQD